jgi:hypothetical protein
MKCETSEAGETGSGIRDQKTEAVVQSLKFNAKSEGFPPLTAHGLPFTVYQLRNKQ